MRRLRLFVGSVVLALLAALLGFPSSLATSAPAAAAEETDPLAQWTMQANFVHTEVSEGVDGSTHNFEYRATYTDTSTDSFDASWTASTRQDSESVCSGSDQDTKYAVHVEGTGTGYGQFWRSSGFPSDYGLTPPNLGLTAGGEPSYEVNGSVTDCNGERHPTGKGQTPITNFVWLPVTEDELSTLPAGTVFADSYSRVVTENINGQTTTLRWTVTYQAKKGPWTDKPACSDGLDNDLDGEVDAGSDPGCADGNDSSEKGPNACDNGLDDDGDQQVDFRIGHGGDPGCSSPEDEDEANDCVDPSPVFTDRSKLMTAVPGPNVHWATTTVRADVCELPDGRVYITGLGVRRHVERGPIPWALGQLGLHLGTETDVEFGPDDNIWDSDTGGAYQTASYRGVDTASARLTYTMCFDVIDLLIDKIGFKGYLQRKLAKPLAEAIERILRRAGISRIREPVRHEVVNAFKARVRRTLNEQTVANFLDRKLHLPGKVVSLVEQAATRDVMQIRRWLIIKIEKAGKTSRYDGYTADRAANTIAGDALGWATSLTSVCSVVDASNSPLRLWDTTLFAVSQQESVQFTPSDHYLHPLMSIL